MLTPNSGLLDSAFSGLGLPQPNWLGQTHLAIIVVLAIDVWERLMFSLVIHTAACGHPDPDLIGAAAVDGASRSQVMRHVTWPLLAPSTILIAIFRFVDALLVIDIVLPP